MSDSTPEPKVSEEDVEKARHFLAFHRGKYFIAGKDVKAELAVLLAEVRAEGERVGREKERADVVAYCDEPGAVGAWKARQDLALELERGDHCQGGK